jgi:hypothetical protein
MIPLIYNPNVSQNPVYWAGGMKVLPYIKWNIKFQVLNLLSLPAMLEDLLIDV